MASPVLLFKKLREEAVLPMYGSADAIGMDLYACEPRMLAPGTYCLVPTGISAAIPTSHYGRVAPRSGLAVRHGVDVLAGVIDADYRGEIVAILINHGPGHVSVNRGDRVAQLILERADRFEPALIAEHEDLPASTRGASGFGSTGR